MSVPSRKVTSFIALRRTVTNPPGMFDQSRVQGVAREEGQTERDSVPAMRLLDEAVKLPHLVQAGFRPPFGGKDGLDLCSEWLEALRMGRKIV